MDFRSLFDYDYWANSETLASLRTVPSGTEKPRKTFNHVIGGQRVWLARFQNPAPPSVQPWPDLTLDECNSAIEDLRHRWKELLDNLTPEKLAGDLLYLSLKGVEYTTPIQDVLMHLILHSAYHRGQVAAAVRQAGGKPASTDYVVYLRKLPKSPE
ncbi:MAG TPA: DinB family protein [Terriglobia bacterium]|nr:DinB family protein [Terriglobia bacterium]